MKKLLALPVLTALLMMLACDKVSEETVQETPNTPETEQLDLTPIVFQSKAADDTRVAIDGYDLKFSVGENIAVASYDYTNETSLLCSDYATFDDEKGSITEPSASGKFNPQNEQYGSKWASSASLISFYSYYPTTAAAPIITGTTATVSNIAATQDGTVNHIVCWAKGSKVATAAEVTAGNAPSFAFSPVCALLKLNIVNSDDNAASITSLSLEATTTSGYITGVASLNLLTGSLSGGSSTTITYSPDSPLAIANNGTQVIYLALIPNASITDWTLNITDSRGEHFLYETSWGDKDLPTALLPGRMYERTLTISSITGVSDLTPPYTYNGVKFVRGFLKRTDNTSTSQTNMRFSDATVNPFEMIGFARATDDSYNQMYFAISDVNTIFGGTSGSSFESNSLQIGGHNYKVPSKDDFEAITKTATARTSNKPSINGNKKAWALVMVTLTDSESATGTDYKDLGFQSANTNANFLRGMLFFPDNGQVICSHIDASKCDAITEEIWGDQTNLSPNTITTTQLMALIDNGCLFLPAIGGRSGTDDSFVGRGNSGYYWSSTYKSSTRAHLLMFSNGSGSETYYYKITDYGIARKFPVPLVDAE